MEKKIKKVEDLSIDGVVHLLKECQMTEFVDFVMEKQIDGRKLTTVTEGIVKLWRPKSNVNKFILFIKDLKNNPDQYLDHSKKDPDKITDSCRTVVNEVRIKTNDMEENVMLRDEKATLPNEPTEIDSKVSIETIESQYQTVKKTKDNNLAFNNVEELIKRIVPAKSFLYRNQGKNAATPSYLPMDSGTPKKTRNLFRISGYDYPKFDLRRFSKQDLGDRGYYPMKRNSRFFIQKSKAPESDSRPKYKSLSSTEELKYPEDHFYEDLCYNDVEDDAGNAVPSISNQNVNVKPYRVKIQELFQSFKMPFFKKNEEEFHEEKREEVKETDTNYYENSDGIANMYDSVHANVQAVESNHSDEKPKVPVEDYLEPVQLNKDYCDVNYQRPKDESLLGYIMSIFENRFGMRRETSESHSGDSEDEKTETEIKRWNEDQKPSKKTNMADRPLPVPVENEPYYMNIDRTEAENLLKGQLDGTFVLRPSSQPNLAYTLSVSCNNDVHNVGVRRRADGRLALGFARRGERSFADVASLLRHHRKRRLLLVVSGSVIGATTLNESPQYYQTPCNIPVKVHL